MRRHHNGVQQKLASTAVRRCHYDLAVRRDVVLLPLLLIATLCSASTATATTEHKTHHPQHPSDVCELTATGECLVFPSSESTSTTTSAAAAANKVEVAASPYSSSTDASSSSSSAPFECELYLAPSTIPGAGLGIFTSKERQPGEVLTGINGDSGDVLIPVVDVQYHLWYSSNQRDTIQFTSDYVWHGAELGMARESAHGDYHSKFNDGVTGFCPGLDAAINCHLALINVDKGYPHYDTMGLHRATDPGAGAFSPYHNCTTVVTAPIPVGGELFKYYGEHWFITRETWFPHVPLSQHYNEAQELLHKFDRVLLRLHNSTTNTNDNHGLPSSSSSSSLSSSIEHDLYQMLKQSRLESRTLNALPSYDKLPMARQHGIRATYQPAATKSLEDLQHNGRCLNTIAVQPSTIHQAGRGVFAMKSFVKDETVAGTPLLVGDSLDFLTLFEGDWYNRMTPPDTNNVTGHQLLLNYCYQHPSAVLFLCPYGYLINLINHNQTQANVKIVWAQDGTMGHNASHLQQSPSHMTQSASPGLFWDYVATREIHQGEELFLDYGDWWEQAWQQHVRNFEQQRKQELYDPNYLSAREYNIKYANSILKTWQEVIQHPYPDHLEIRCLNELGDTANYIEVNVDETSSSHYPVLQSTLSSEDANELWTIANVGSECKILRRDIHPNHPEQQQSFVYTIELIHSIWSNTNEKYSYATFHISNVDRSAIRFMDVPYTTDLFLPTAFRHPIGIPEEIFPKAWIGYRADEESE